MANPRKQESGTPPEGGSVRIGTGGDGGGQQGHRPPKTKPKPPKKAPPKGGSKTSKGA